MNDSSKTSQELFDEISVLKQRISELEQSESERKCAEAVLRTSEEKYRLLFESFPLGISITDDKGIIIESNAEMDNLYRRLGRGKRRKSIFDPVPRVIRPDGREKPLEEYASVSALREKRLVAGVEVGIHTKKSEIAWLNVTAGPIPLEGFGVAIAYKDITERKRAEVTLRESEERYRTMVENSNDAIYLHDYDGNIIDVNDNACRMVGYERHELIGANLGMIDAKWRRPENPELERLIHESHLVFERENICKDGSIIPVEVSVRIVHRGGTDIIQGFVRDITNRKRLEKAFRENETRFRLIAENMSDMIRLTDVHGTNIYVSPSHEKHLGYRPEERTGRHIMEFVHPDDIERVHRVFSKSITKKIPLKTEYRLKHANGHYIWLETVGDIIYGENGEMKGGIFSSRDITDRKRLTSEIEKSRGQLRLLAAQLESSREDERTNLAREIHDELGQALTALKMDLAWITKKLPKEQTALLDKARSMQKLLDDNVKLARDITTRLRPAILDDFGLLAAIEWQASDFDHRTGIKCMVKSNVKKINVNKKLSISLFRVFQEALTNIAKHSDASRVVISLMKKNSKVTMEIRDDGKGIKKSQLRKKGAFGILGIMERVSLMGGSLDIDGLPGKGTTLRVSIPTN